MSSPPAPRDLIARLRTHLVRNEHRHGFASPPEFPCRRCADEAAHSECDGLLRSAAAALEQALRERDELKSHDLSRIAECLNNGGMTDDAFIVGQIEAMKAMLAKAERERDEAEARGREQGRAEVHRELMALVGRWHDVDIEGHAHDPAVAFAQGVLQCADELEAVLRQPPEQEEG